jgi:AcrR family transcriptional regulator
MSKTQEERSEATRKALTAAGRKLFGSRGFNDTSIEQVVQEAKVTKGALYHHFAGKKELFIAVTDEVESEVLINALASLDPEDASWVQIETGVLHFLGQCVDPEIQQVLLHDGPIVLGWERWHYSEQRFGMGTVYDRMVTIEGLENLNQPTMTVLANMFAGVLMEAAKTIAYSDDPEKAREPAAILIRHIIKAIRESASEMAALQ